MRHQEPFTLPSHPELLEELNEMSIAIKVNHLSKIGPIQTEHLLQRYPEPKWEDIENLLMRSYEIINELRYNPIKY